MKKLLLLLILSLSVFAFTACGWDEYNEDDDDYANEEQDEKRRKDDKDSKNNKDDKNDKDDAGKDDINVQPSGDKGDNTDNNVTDAEGYRQMIQGTSWHYGTDRPLDSFYTFYEDGTWEMYGEGGADEFGSYEIDGNNLKLSGSDYVWEMTIVSSEKLMNSEGEELVRYVRSDYDPDDDPDDDPDYDPDDDLDDEPDDEPDDTPENNIMAERRGMETMYEDIARKLRLDVLGEPIGMEVYGNYCMNTYDMPGLRYSVFMGDESTAKLDLFCEKLERAGIRRIQTVSIDVGEVVSVYAGTLEGYEQYGTLNVILGVAESGSLDVYWRFSDFGNMPLEKDELLVTNDFETICTEIMVSSDDFDSPYEAEMCGICVTARNAARLYSLAVERMESADIYDTHDYYYIFTGNNSDEEYWYGVKVCQQNSDGAYEAVYILAEMWEEDWELYDTLSGSLEKIEEL